MAWYQRNYFSSNNSSEPERWIHSFYEIEGKKYRAYDTNKSDYSNEGVFWNEVGIFFEKIIEDGLKVFYFSTKPKLNTTLTEEDLLFFKTYEKYNNSLQIPENLKQIRDAQCKDLLLILNGFLMETFIVFSKVTDNKYHYELLAGVKPEFNLETFLKINFNIINIISVNQIFQNNLNYDFIKQIFDFNLIQSFCPIFEKDFLEYRTKIIFTKTEESLNLERYETFKYKTDPHWNSNNDEYFCWLWNESAAKHSEMMDEYFCITHSLKDFGFYWYILNYNFKDAVFDRNLKTDIYTEPTYPNNSSFVLILRPALQATVLKKTGNNKLELYEEVYDRWCLYDWVASMRADSEYSVDIIEISVPKLKWGSAYKPRQNQKNTK